MYIHMYMYTHIVRIPMCEGDKSGSAIGVLRNALGMCKREAGRSESAIGVTKTGRPSGRGWYCA